MSVRHNMTEKFTQVRVWNSDLWITNQILYLLFRVQTECKIRNNTDSDQSTETFNSVPSLLITPEPIQSRS